MLPGMRVLILVVLLCVSHVARAEQSSAPGGIEQLTALRLDARNSRRVAGFWLLGFGVVSTLGGAAVAVTGRDNQAFLAAGITTLSFGAVNGLLSLGLLDLSLARERAILDERARTSRRACPRWLVQIQLTAQELLKGVFGCCERCGP